MTIILTVRHTTIWCITHCAMCGSIPHAMVYAMNYVVCIGIPYDHMTKSHCSLTFCPSGMLVETKIYKISWNSNKT